ncbi:hypothetical protein SAMN05428642_102131 [Flaviramulus basaltis]|uniref:Secreted protein n=1 Tax=Flaviramulus basaltis TaxID=369401 RepID=A0A1K2IGP7_9FLAO|nr:hypothetical protein [Flaviramulus basaltis]SFZ91551.1 hypothetical protein SAMN05428642_102131 [Flaviramulus basaltis]
MKTYIVQILLIFFTLSINAQIDSKKKYIAIPAIKSKKDSADISPLTPSKPIKNNTFGMNMPKVSPNLEQPKEEFSMFPKEKFGNPGELYEKQVDKNLANLKLTPEEVEKLNGNTTDQFLGDFKSKAKFVNVVYRDHGYVDGDVIQVLINDDIIYPRVYLTGGFKGFKLDLKTGFNKIDFLALNQGESGPNTAEFKVIDDNGIIVSHNQWNLATGVKATIIVVKE